MQLSCVQFKREAKNNKNTKYQRIELRIITDMDQPNVKKCNCRVFNSRQKLKIIKVQITEDRIKDIKDNNSHGPTYNEEMQQLRANVEYSIQDRA